MTAGAERVDALLAALRASDGVAARLRAAEVEQDERWAVLAGAATTPLAVELLIEELDASGTVRRFVRRLLLDEHAVDDVVQDSLVSVASSLAGFDGRSKVSTWVHQIVQRRVVDHLRRQRATTPLPADDLAPSARISSVIATRATVQGAVAALPELYREPVVMRDLHGLEYAEIAGRLDRSLGTVKSQIARGRALVAATLGDHR